MSRLLILLFLLQSLHDVYAQCILLDDVLSHAPRGSVSRECFVTDESTSSSREKYIRAVMYGTETWAVKTQKMWR